MIRSINLWNRIDRNLNPYTIREYKRIDDEWTFQIYKVMNYDEAGITQFVAYLYKDGIALVAWKEFFACDTETMLDWAESKIEEYSNMKYGFLK